MKFAVLSVFTALALSIAVTPEARALDLDRVLHQVATANPTLAARREMVEAARRRVAPAGAWESPTIEVGAINVPSNGRFDSDPMTMKMIGVSQRLPLFGANGLRRESARAALGAAGADQETTRYELFAMAWEAYADAYFTDQVVRSVTAHQGELDRLVRSAEARYRSGNGRLEDVLRSQAEYARLQADLASSRSEWLTAVARLNELMGRDPQGSVDSLEAPPEVSVPDQPAPWLAVAATHPRLRGLEAEMNRYRLAARAARRAVWPDLELKASYGMRSSIAGMPQDDMWSATLGFMLPIFAQQRERSEAAEMDAITRAKEAELLAARLDLERQIVATHAAAMAARRTVSLLADTVVVTQRRAVAASFGSYVSGASDLWRVFEATHALYAEELALIRARQELARTEARLLSITARGDLLGLSLPASQGNDR